MNRCKKPQHNNSKQVSKPKPIIQESKVSLRAMKKGAKSHIIDSLLTSFVRSVRKPQANTFPYGPHTLLMSNLSLSFSFSLSLSLSLSLFSFSFSLSFFFLFLSLSLSLLYEKQSGFRTFYSTTTALLDATTEWLTNMDKGLLNSVIYLDLAKAFDTVNHDILLSKLHSYGIDANSLCWFHSYLQNRTQKCFVNGYLSNECALNCGVPQGSILGPLLFLIYINDFPHCLQHSTARMYADDTNITTTGSSIREIV